MTALAAQGASAPDSRFVPLTGREYLDSLNDDREVWIYGERVRDIANHPAFRNSARMIARMYDALHDPKRKDVLTVPTEWGGYTQRFFRAPHTVEEQVAQRDAIAEWQKVAWGWMGRSPDYKGAFLATLGANAGFYKGFEENASRWYRKAQERTWYVNHAIMHPPVDRDLPTADGSDVFVKVVKETDAGIYVSGAKVVATNSALTHYTFVAHVAQVPIADPNFARRPPAALSTIRCPRASMKTTRSSCSITSLSLGKTSSCMAIWSRPTSSTWARAFSNALRCMAAPALPSRWTSLSGCWRGRWRSRARRVFTVCNPSLARSSPGAMPSGRFRTRWRKAACRGTEWCAPMRISPAPTAC